MGVVLPFSPIPHHTRRISQEESTQLVSAIVVNKFNPDGSALIWSHLPRRGRTTRSALRRMPWVRSTYLGSASALAIRRPQITQLTLRVSGTSWLTHLNLNRVHVARKHLPRRHRCGWFDLDQQPHFSAQYMGNIIELIREHLVDSHAKCGFPGFPRCI